MSEMIELKLTKEDIQLIFAVLGDVPTKFNTWPVLMKIKSQVDPQMGEGGASDAPLPVAA